MAAHNDARHHDKIRVGLSVDETALLVAMVTIFAVWVALLVLILSSGFGGAGSV